VPASGALIFQVASAIIQTMSDASERAIMRAEIREMMIAGRSDMDIMVATGMSGDPIGFKRHKKAIIDLEVVDANRPAVEVFVEYQRRQVGNINDLEEARGKAMKDQSWGHAVTAARAKASILDNIIAKGQDLGVYYKKGQTLRVQGAMALVHMTAGDLAEQLEDGFDKMEALARDMGKPLVIHEGALRLDSATLGPGDMKGHIEVKETAEVSPEAIEAALDGRAMAEVGKMAGEAPSKADSEPHEAYLTGEGDPGEDKPLDERIVAAAMAPTPGSRGTKSGEIRGDPLKLRGKQVLSCPRCSRSLNGIPAMTNHLRFKHDVDPDKAREASAKLADAARKHKARQYAKGLQESATGTR